MRRLVSRPSLRSRGPEPHLLETGQVIDGRYRIEGIVGHGGMGVVYRARHLKLGAPRAIKVMNDSLASNADFRRRFLNEARLAARLRHRNLVALHDLSQLDDGNLYIVWEFLEGQTVAQLLQTDGPFDAPTVARIIGQAADGMTVAHRQGIIHGDLSPDNLMLAEDDSSQSCAKVLDFGMAKVIHEESPGRLYSTLGIALGKIGYSSPEQVTLLETGLELDERTDVFSLAVVAYQMLTGKLPFRSTSVHAFVFDVAATPEAQLRARFEARLPPPWRAALSPALVRDRESRTPNMRALKAAIEHAAKLAPVVKPTTGGVATPRVSLEVSTPFEGGVADESPITLRWSDVSVDTESTLARLVRGAVSRRGAAALLGLVAFVAILTWVLTDMKAPDAMNGVRTTTSRVGQTTSTPAASAINAELQPRKAASLPSDNPSVAASAKPTPRVDSTPAPRAETRRHLDAPGTASVEGPKPKIDTPPLALSSEPLPTPTLASTESREAPVASDATPLNVDSEKMQTQAAETPGFLSAVRQAPGAEAFGTLAVTADFWARVSLDGNPSQQTPAIFRRVPAGRHVLRVVRPGYIEQVHDVDIHEDVTTRLRIEMRKAR